MNHFRFMLGRFFLAFCVVALLSTLPLLASPGGEMAEAANNWLKALTPEQQAKGTFAFENDERFDWHFIPKARKGLPLAEMTPEQRKLAQTLLNSGLSQLGYAKALDIMSLENVLKETEQGKGPERNPEKYFFTIFGKPDGKDAWGWRVEGHHLSLNFVVRGGEVLSATPTFYGTNPAKVLSGPRQGFRVLRDEEVMGRSFMKSLSPKQQKLAILDIPAPKEMITGNARKVQLLKPPGLPAKRMSAEEKEELRQLIKMYAFRHRKEVAEADLKKIEDAGFDKVTFAWAGGLQSGDPHYYRIQGPTFLIEYDDTQNNANHIHTVWRDLANDFGEDALRKHYDEVPHDK